MTSKEEVKQTLRALEADLGRLAGEYRFFGIQGQEEEQAQIVVQYHAVMREMHALGWSGGLDLEAHLPFSKMPYKYLERLGSYITLFTDNSEEELAESLELQRRVESGEIKLPHISLTEIKKRRNV